MLVSEMPCLKCGPIKNPLIIYLSEGFFVSKNEIQFSSYGDMISRLRDKGMDIIDYDTAEIILKNRGYFNLINRYKHDSYKPNSNEYKSGTTLTEFYIYDRFESELKNLLFRSTINVEHRIKEAMSYIISKEISVNNDIYLNTDQYSLRSKKQTYSVIKKVKKVLEDCSDFPTAKYREEKGIVPPWILFNNLSFGQTRMFFSIFNGRQTKYVIEEILPLKTEIYLTNFSRLEIGDRLREFATDKAFELNKNIYPEFDTRNVSDDEFDKGIRSLEMDLIQFTKSMLTTIHKFRNVIAHGNGLLHYKTPKEATIKFKSLMIFLGPKTLSRTEYNKGLGKNDVFSLMIALILLSDEVDAIYFIRQLKDWTDSNKRDSAAKTHFPKFINMLGLPSNFVQRLDSIYIGQAKKRQRYKPTI